MMNTNSFSADNEIVTPVSNTPLQLPIQLAESKSIMAAEAGTVLTFQNAAFTVPAGGAVLNVPRFQVDDWGFCGAVPVGCTRSSTPAEFKIDCRKTEDNMSAYGGHTQWGGSISHVFLPPGDYILVIEQQNEHITAVSNKSLGEYEVSIVPCVPPPDPTPEDDDDVSQPEGGDSADTLAPPVVPVDEPQFCPVCGCGSAADEELKTSVPGDAVQDACSRQAKFETNDAQAVAPAAGEVSGAEAPVVLPGGFRMNDAWNWALAYNAASGLITVTPPAAAPLYFRARSGSATALAAGGSRMYDFSLQLQDAQGNPCADGSHALFCLVAQDGSQLRFDCSGRVVSQRSVSGRVTQAVDAAAAVVYKADAAGYIESVYSEAEGLMRCSQMEDGSMLSEWFAPAQVTRQGEAYGVSGAPYKTETHRTTLLNGVKTLVITRRQGELPEHVITRVENGNTTTTTQGVGAEAVIRTVVKNMLSGNQQEEIESVCRAGDTTPASCTRTLRQCTDGGWLTLETTEAFGTPLARTTYYAYNAQYRLIRVLRPDGAYTEYEYDAEGRVSAEIIPWAEGGRKRTRYVYAAESSRFHDTRPVKVYEDIITKDGASLNISVTDYTYADAAEVERTTATTYAAGVSHQQVSIEEVYGEAAAYPFAAGKPKFSQAVNGVQTFHEYAATTEHGAAHKHTTTTMAGGGLVAARSRKTEAFIAANGTTAFEQVSIWDGAAWQLLETTAYEYDEQQRVVKTTRGNGRFSTTDWMCCGKLRETDEDGITTTYTYNSAHELTEITRAAVYDGDTCITPETITEYTRDAAGRVLATTRHTGAMQTSESTVYDALGRVTSRTDVLGRVTTTAYSADGLTTTVTNPAGATFITVQNPDGSIREISGTGQRKLAYSYDLNGSNLRTTVRNADGAILSQTITNGFNQTVVQAQPNTLDGFIYTRSEYNALGLMVKQYQDTGWNTEKTAPTLYEYDSFGNQVKQILALADSPTKDNSPVSEVAYSVESAEDGVYSVTTQTRYNAEGTALNSTQKQLISQLSDTLASKSISTDERGNSATEWSEFTSPSKVTSYSTVPTSEIVAEAVSVDGFTTSQKDYAGITTSASRSYTATGIILVQVDGRGNATTTATDLAGRTISVTDATGAVTTTAYDAAHDLPSVVTDAMGNTACYKYDHRGRKIAEWGTAIQPACFGYDDMDNMTALRTFRAGTEIISSDPTERTDGDVTTWAFHPATGLELSKTYADGTAVVKTYDAYNRLATETDARGNVKTHSYEHARGLHLGTTYTVVDGTADTGARSFTYNHLGQMTQLTDDSGVRTFTYNTYGELECDSLAVDGDTHLVTELRDDFGRSIGYTYAKNGSVLQSVSTGYGTDGRISSAGFLHGSEMKQFGYEYLQGSNLLHKLTKPNGMTLTQSYETQRDLLTGMAYHRGSTLVAQREYTYDVLSRPTARTTSRQGNVVNDTFVHNSRSELASAQVNGETYGYDYDNVGNRRMSMEAGDYAFYEANELNQYTDITGSEDEADFSFTPTFDADGNQTVIKTETGIWTAVYNAENRPVSFTNEATGTVVTCAYDSMGRRSFKQVTTNGTVTLHQRYLYRSYLQIACLDLTRSHHPGLWLITWDPTQPIATRPLAIQKNGTWYTYGLDLTKNACEVFGSAGYIATTYTYSPYGKVTASSNVQQPIQWSSEFHDEEIGLIYYNYRYLDYKQTRWSSRDIISDILCHPYSYVENAPISKFDLWGNKSRYSGTAPVYDKNIWEDYKLLNNCYSYACNVRYTEDMLNEKQKQWYKVNNWFKPQPGIMTNTDNLNFLEDCKGDPNCIEYIVSFTIEDNYIKSMTRVDPKKYCDEIAKRAINDGMKKANGDCCPKRYHRVYLVVESTAVSRIKISGSNNYFLSLPDYHWFREDQGGTWSHKPGNTSIAQIKKENMLDKNSPERKIENDNYIIHYDFDCGYLCAPDF